MVGVLIASLVLRQGATAPSGSWLALSPNEGCTLSFSAPNGYHIERQVKGSHLCREFGHFTQHGHRLTMVADKTFQENGKSHTLPHGVIQIETIPAKPIFGRTRQLSRPTSPGKMIRLAMPYGKEDFRRLPESK